MVGPVLQWAMMRCDLMELRELYGQVMLQVPPSMVQLCLYCLTLRKLGKEEAPCRARFSAETAVCSLPRMP